MNLKLFNYIYKPFIFLLLAALLFFNGVELGYKVNWQSIVLIGILILPIILQLIREIKSENVLIKAGDYEINFRNLPLEKQIIFFLNGVIRLEQWTFYETRPNETNLGGAFRILVDDLIRLNQNDFYLEIKKWLNSENENQMWFASEVIGYYQISDFKNHLKEKIQYLDKNEIWATYQLNFLWAISRFNNYKELNEFILSTSNVPNIQWLLFVYSQIVHEKKGQLPPIKDIYRQFKIRKDLPIVYLEKFSADFEKIIEKVSE